MAPRGVGRAILAATLVGAAFVAGRSCALGGEPTPPAPPTRTTAEAVRRPQRSNRMRDAVPSAAATPDDARPRDAAVSPSAELFPAIDVEVVSFEGAPVADCAVYGVPAGAPGTDDLLDVAHASTDDAGRCRLHVPRAGRFDVGAVHDALAAMTPDVDGPGHVRIALPETAPVVVRCSPDALPAGDEKKSFRATLTLAAGDAGIQFPGRGQPYAWSRSLSPQLFESESRAMVFQLPRGADAKLETCLPNDAFPRRFTAPAEVTIAPYVGLRAEVGIAFVEPDRTWPRPVHVRLDLRWESGSPERPLTPVQEMFRMPHADVSKWEEDLEAAHALGNLAGATWTVCLSEAAGIVRWSGPGLLPGELAYRGVTADGSTKILLPVRLDPSGDLPSAESTPSDQVTLRLARNPAVAGDVTTRWYYSSADGRSRSSSECAYAECEDDVLDDSTRWVAVTTTTGFWALADLRARTAPLIELRLEPGGFLVVLPERPLPPEIGTVWIERADGAPFLAFRERDATFCETEVRYPAAAGLVLGPLSPGPTTFRLRACGLDLGEARATVRAGTYEPLRLPALPPR